VQEAEAVRFGIFEATTRGLDVVDAFRGRVVQGAACSEAEVLHALRVLREGQQLVLLRRENAQSEEPAGWVFRSRMGELVRLLVSLRQRFARQLVADAPPLVADLLWDVRPRRYPRRDTELADYLAGVEPVDRAIVLDALLRLDRARRGASDEDDED